MEQTSKDLLHLEHKNSSIESALLICNKKEFHSQSEKQKPDEKLIYNQLPQSQVLGKVKDFLGVISEANKRLQLDAKDNAQEYDIEVLTGNESEVIEMDLMLGIADLHTPDAITAAELAIAGNQAVIPLAASSSSGSESEESSDYADKDDEDEHSDNDDVNKDDKKAFSMKLKKSKAIKAESEVSRDKKSQKRQKIVEL